VDSKAAVSYALPATAAPGRECEFANAGIRRLAARHRQRLQSRILLLPTVKRLLRNTDLANQLSHWYSHFGLLQNSHDLLHRIALVFHDKPPATRVKFAKKLTSRWHEFSRADQGP